MLTKAYHMSNTPTNTPLVCGNCDRVFKQSVEVMDSEHDIKTSDNDLKVDYTPNEQGEQNQNVIVKDNKKVSVVYVRNMKNKVLMSCSPRKARILLK